MDPAKVDSTSDPATGTQMSQVVSEAAEALVAGEQLDYQPPRPPGETRELFSSEQEEAEAERKRAKRQRMENAQTFFKTIGRRYEKARFETFRAVDQDQRFAVAKLKAFGETLAEHVTEGHGVVLFGPSGTGKDHLLIALAVVALKKGFKVGWKNGATFFGDLRATMDRNSAGSEDGILLPLEHKSILVLSDPVPPSGTLTEYQATMLLRLVDSRYRQMRPTWVTMNVQNRGDAEKKLGSAIVDRLRDNSLCLFCNWPSYRKSLGD